MMTIRKLETLGARTRLNKCALIFHDIARSVHGGSDIDDMSYIQSIFNLVLSSHLVSDTSRERLGLLSVRSRHQKGKDLATTLLDASHLLLTTLGAEPSEWDFISVDGGLDTGRREIRPFTVILDRIRSPYNIGALFRTADSFGVKEIILIEGCASPLHTRAKRTARGCTETVDWSMMDEESVIDLIHRRKVPVFALETGGVNIAGFPFPPEGIMVVGNEEFGVSPALLRACQESAGRLSLLQAGTKASLNVSVAFGIVMHAWFTA
ncbi:TrmH family RNA methyltransferase [Parasphaerochaeta coccoides]|uniref:tRNA/rRNA methyltransferase (SpoU) n=1 Tax=Parasphaerochaeta coccoides (strain ATCC BAA-1237 / DSM 17374 / SPN1) TaxID=760011 RepID=F4GJV8_PARC1|nr:TrmH family RNA methyltransferase [Parasphaerochaeta coccoides]AEC01383.1 tRNA/rRNA methyltransferase (SpoU) [Parasphaerochaeta coccoides DSM 17374]